MLRLLALALPLTFASAQTHAVSESEVERVQRSSLLIDTHNDITSATVDGFDICATSPEHMTDCERLRQGGVGATFFAAYVAARYAQTGQAAHRALEMIDTVRHDIVARHPGQFEFVTTAAGIEEAHRRGKIAALIGIEGGHAIENSLRLLRDFYALGVRYMTLTHANTNDWADSSGDAGKPGVQHHNGLTPFGRDVVREMNRLGMMVDISHVADKTFWDVLEVSTAPPIASHSSCRALSNVKRNMTDDMIRALARKGGVVQINFGCEFLSQRSADAGARFQEKSDSAKSEAERSALRAVYRKKVPRATLDDVVAHIDHVVKLAGVDAAGIGSDFDGIECAPAGLDDVSKFPNLTRALLARGYSAADIQKIYGGNILRVMRAVEAEAARMQGAAGESSAARIPARPVHTYSIVARDPRTGEMGVAVQSHWFSVGTEVVWAEAGVGAVATQSFVDPSYGPLGLDLMRAGKSAPEALQALLAGDSGREVRQVAMVDAHGRVSAHTGSKCISAAGHRIGEGFSAQANLMDKATVWPAMARAFDQASGDLTGRLLAALEAAQAEGGDIRGKQSAAILVVKAKSTGRPWADRVVDLRVEDSLDPLAELRRLISIHRAYQHMNAGDLCAEKKDWTCAGREYAAAEQMQPDNTEMIFWHAVTLVTAGRMEESLPLFRKVFARDPQWAELRSVCPPRSCCPRTRMFWRASGRNGQPRRVRRQASETGRGVS